ncbi:MAG: hypothetical protein [Caudoviricetes sp.]|nr:MAG: hypothetical protein [Caudoviricetes sp.]
MIEKVKYEDFIPEIAIGAEGISAEMAENFIRLTANDFCKKTNILQRETKLTIWEGNQNYEFDIEDGEEVNLVHSIKVPHCLDGCVDIPRTQYRFTYPNIIRLMKIPDYDNLDGIRINYSATPSLNSCDVDALVLTNHSEAIQFGTLARLYLLKSMPWFDSQLAVVNDKLYKDKIREAGVRRLLNYETGPKFIRPVRVV